MPVFSSHGLPTFSRASIATVDDWERRTRYCKSGEARFAGARRVENLVNGSSEDWTNGAWTKTNMTVTARRLTADANNATVICSAATSGKQTHVARIRITRVTGTGDVDITLDNGATWTTLAVSATETIFSVSQATLTNPQVGLRLKVQGDEVDADQIQVEAIGGQANTNPSEYVSVGVESSGTFFHGANVDGVKYFHRQNGNTVASSVVTEALGTAIAEGNSGPLLALEPIAATNECPNSNDYSAWTATNATLSNDDVVGPDGVQGVATTLTANAANGQIELAMAGLTSGIYAITVWVKRKTGGGNFQLRSGNSATYFTQSTHSGEDGWTRVRLFAGTATTDPTFGIRLGTNGDAVYLFGVQFELTGNNYGALYHGEMSTYVNGLGGSSYVPTSGGAATRAAESCSIPVGGLNQGFTVRSRLGGGCITKDSVAFQQMKPHTQNRTWWCISDGTLANRVQHSGQSGNADIYKSFVASVQTGGIAMTGGTPSDRLFQNAGMLIRRNLLTAHGWQQAAVNQYTPSAEDTSLEVPQGMNVMHLGQLPDGTEPGCLFIGRIVISRMFASNTGTNGYRVQISARGRNGPAPGL